MPHAHDGAARARPSDKPSHSNARAGRPVAAEAADGTGFAGAARDMVHGALKTFRKEIAGILKDVGLTGDEIGNLIKSLMDPIKAALRSGADFSAQVVVAAATQITAATKGGVSTAIDLVAKGIDITVNHSTGEVSISTASIEFHAHETDGGEPQRPLFVDFDDDGDGRSRDLFGQFDDYLRSLADAFELAGPAADAADADGEDTQPDHGPAETSAPTLATSDRIRIEAIEDLINDNGDRLTRLRLDAVITLMIGAGEPAPGLGEHATREPVSLSA